MTKQNKYKIRLYKLFLKLKEDDKYSIFIVQIIISALISLAAYYLFRGVE